MGLEVVEEDDEDFEKSEAVREAELEQQQAAAVAALAASPASTAAAKADGSGHGIAPRLMQKISAKKEVTEETVLVASDVPPLGVKSDHPSELDKVGMHFTIG